MSFVSTIFLLCAIILVLASLGILLIEIKAHLDRILMTQSLAILSLVLFSIPDLLQLTLGHHAIVITKLQHFIFLCVIQVLFWHCSTLTGTSNLWIIRAVRVVSALLAILLFTDFLFYHDGTHVLASFLYVVSFIPFLLLCGVLIVIHLLSYHIKNKSVNSLIILMNIWGFSFVLAGGVLDQLCLVYLRLIPDGVSMTLICIFAYSILLMIILLKRLITLVLERAVLMQKIENLSNEMNCSSVFADVGRNTTMLSHEIKNKAFSLSLLLHNLRKSLGATDSKVKNQLQCIQRQIDLIANDCIDIMIYSCAGQETKRSLIDVVTVIKTCISSHFSGRENAFCLRSLTDQKVHIWADARKMEAVFHNLFKNALEAGAFTIIVEWKFDHNTAVIDIIDDGTGCTTEQMRNMFSLFHSTHAKPQGFGIGLLFVRSFIEQFGGQIEMIPGRETDAVNPGMTVRLRLPVGNRTPVSYDPKRENSSVFPLKGSCI
ncbi:MAG: HAMP domain-containing histidine kinase [Chitinivibrionales bacterium]|nr:HAMP domain-containing histidine kinase [Chitinivibrionales bacterium]